MSKFDPAVTLPQTIDFITEAQTLVVGISLEQLIADPIKLRAFERVMELVGESVKRVPQDFRDTHSQIPWKKIAGMRDVIIMPTRIWLTKFYGMSSRCTFLNFSRI